MLWENLTDPILTGREELGFSKIYCELPEPQISGTEAQCSAGWLGFNFMNMSLSDLVPKPVETASESGDDTIDGTLHYKYIPKTGEWGVPDVSYPVITPVSGGHRKILEESVGDGNLTWNRARWEDLPTQFNVINALADLELVEVLGGTLTRSIGGKDLSDQRILY